MSRYTGSRRVGPLRVRYADSPPDEPVDPEWWPTEIVDLAWSDDEDDPDPLSIAFLDKNSAPGASSPDLEDPTDPDNDRYPPSEPSFLPEVSFVRCAASHWQRVHPRMRRFTQTDLATADFMTELGGVRAGLNSLVKDRRNCAYVLERKPNY